MKKIEVNIKHTLLSFLGMCGILLYLRMYTTSSYIYSNIIAIPIFIILYYFINKINFKLNKSENIGCIIFSILYTLFLIIGTQLEINSDIAWNFKTLITLVFCFIPIYICFKYLFNFINKLIIKKSKKEKQIKHIKLFVFGVIFLGNLITFLALYPGVYGYDAGFEILEFMDNNVQLTSHFSIIYSFFISSCVSFGVKYLNSAEIGFAIYTFIQLLFIVFVTSQVTLYIYKRFKNNTILYCCLLFFGFFPLHTVMIVSSSQDVIFSGIFTLIILKLLQYANNDLKLNYIECIKFTLLFALLCMFRNNGVYALLIGVPFIIIFTKEHLKFTIIILCSIGLYQIYKGPIFDYLGVYNKSPLIEMSSIPSQQLARVYNYSYDNLTKKEIELINTLYPNQEFHIYKVNQLISDAMKKDFNPEEFKSKPLTYINMYLKIGLKEPENYIEAFLIHNLGLWYPNKQYYDYRMYHPYIELNMVDTETYSEYITIKRTSVIPIYKDLLYKLLNDYYWTKMPIVSMLFQASTYFHLYILSLIFVLARKKYNLLPIISLLGGLYITVLLSPVILFRYNYAFMLCFPIIFFIILNKPKKTVS